MKFGTQLNVYGAQWDDMHTYIQTMEAGRWNSLWLPDHFLPPVGSKPTAEEEQPPAYEAFIPLAVVAGMTKRLKLGSLVLGNTYRNPALVWPRWLPSSIRRLKAASPWGLEQAGSSVNTRLMGGIFPP